MVSGFLAALRSRDVQVWAEGDRLRCTAPVGVLTPELRQELQERKDEILAFLRSAEALARQQPAIVPLQPRGARTPVFAVGGHNGDVFCYRALARHLGDDQPFFGLQPPALDGKSEPLARVEDLAAYFADQIRAFQPHGAYIVAGFCAGGTVAFELAQQLQRGGARISFVAFFACPYAPWFRFPPQLRRRLAQQMERVRGYARALGSLSWRDLREYVTEKVRARKGEREAAQAAARDPVLIRRARVERVTLAAVRRYTPRHFAGRLALFSPTHQWVRSFTPRWRAVAQRTDEYLGPEGCTGDSILLEPYAARVADLFRRCREEFEHGDLGSPLAVASSAAEGSQT
jgi:thioesterase domain-containing protein